MSRIGRWIDQRNRQVLWIILAVALVLRLITFFELSDSSAVRLNRFEDSDMAFFNAWGQQLARGEHLLSEAGVTHPVHTWHRQVASEYLSVRPELLGGRQWNELEPREQLNAEGRLWYGWYGETTFHQEPLYPYLLAICYGIFGAETWVIQVLQMLVGVANLALLYQVTRIYFGNLVGLLAAGIAALHAPALHYEFFLLRAPLICFAGLLLVYLAERLRSAPTPRRWLGFGIACGLAAALKASFGLFGLVLAVYLAWPRGGPRGPTGIRVALWSLGALIALLPAFLRNLLVGAPVFSITSIGPVTFAVTNHAAYVANSNWTVNAPAVARIMGQSGGEWLATIGATLATHDGVLSYLGLLWAKFCQIWQWLDIPNNTNFYFVRQGSAVLTWLPVTFTVVASLGLVGLAAAWLRRQLAVPLLMLIGISIVQMVGFYVLARFRLPMTMAMAPFAALGLVSLWQWFRGGEIRRALIWTGAAVLFALWIQRPMDPARPVIGSGDYQLAHSRYYFPEWEAAANRGEWQRAEKLLRQAIEIRPDDLDGIGMNTRRITAEQLGVIRVYQETYRHYATTLQKLGASVEARQNQARAEVLTAIMNSVSVGGG